jgi:hypothetical protein
MTEESILREIRIRNFINRITLSKKRKSKHYLKNGTSIPKKYQTEKYDFNKDGVLIDITTHIPVVKNIRTAGKERTIKISGQDIWVGMNHHLRSKISKELKKFFYDAIKECQVLDDKDYPIGISIDIYDVIQSSADIDNFEHIYRKCLHDALAGNIEFVKNENGKFSSDKENYISIIKDDNLNYVRQMVTTFYPIENHDDSQMIIKLYKL